MVIASIAATQHGVVSRSALVDAGVPEHAIGYRVRTGRIRCLFRGVYRVGPVRSDHEREMAAVLACGEAAVLSHRSAASMWKLLPSLPPDTPVDISIPGAYRRPGSSVRVHRVARIDADEKARLRGIPVTTPARTLLDLAGTVSEGKVEQALATALRENLTDGKKIGILLTRYPRRIGTPLIRALLDGDGGPAFTRSEAELRFLRLIREGRLPRPKANVHVKGFEVDFVWLRERLVVEMDGFEFHSSRAAFERDRRRDAVLAGAGFRVVRVTWRQLTQEKGALLVSLAQALVQPGR